MTMTGQFAAFADKASPYRATHAGRRKIGVPGGLAYRQCNEKDRAFAGFKPGKPMPREICGLTGGKRSTSAWPPAISTSASPAPCSGATAPTCSAEHFCRDDYICQAFPADTPNVKKVKGVGFCSPTYFVFQMRIDNHTTPWSKGTGCWQRASRMGRREEPAGIPVASRSTRMLRQPSCVRVIVAARAP